MSPVMARCRHSWPIRECTECAPPRDDDPYGVALDETPPAAIAVTIGGIAALGYVLLGATLGLAARIAWHVARTLTGHP